MNVKSMRHRTNKGFGDQQADKENNIFTMTIIFKVIKFSSYFICLSLFVISSLGIVRNYVSSIKIKSASVVPSPNGILGSPTVVLCNSTAFKEQILPSSWISYQNNTMRMKDALLKAYHVKNTTHGLFDYDPTPILHEAREMATLFHGTCIVSEKRLQVRQINLQS